MVPRLLRGSVAPHGPSLICDGVTDNAGALQAMILAAQKAGGGTVALPAGVCATSRRLIVTGSNVLIQGVGAGYPSGSPGSTGTALLWIGAPGGTLLQIGAQASEVRGGGLDGVALLSNHGKAAYGLRLKGVQGARFANFSADAFSAAAVLLDRTRFNQMHNLFETYALDNEENAGDGIVVGTAAVNSAYYNEFHNGWIQLKDGVGIELLKSDGNLFINTHEFMVGWGKGIGVVFGCGSVSNHFTWLTPGYTTRSNAVHVLGEQACGWPREAWADSIDLYDQNNNGGPKPIVGQGTDFHCRNDVGKPCGSRPGP